MWRWLSVECRLDGVHHSVDLVDIRIVAHMSDPEDVVNVITVTRSVDERMQQRVEAEGDIFLATRHDVLADDIVRIVHNDHNSDVDNFDRVMNSIESVLYWEPT